MFYYTTKNKLTVLESPKEIKTSSVSMYKGEPVNVKITKKEAEKISAKVVVVEEKSDKSVVWPKG